MKKSFPGHNIKSATPDCITENDVLTDLYEVGKNSRFTSLDKTHSKISNRSKVLETVKMVKPKKRHTRNTSGVSSSTVESIVTEIGFGIGYGKDRCDSIEDSIGSNGREFVPSPFSAFDDLSVGSESIKSKNSRLSRHARAQAAAKIAAASVSAKSRHKESMSSKSKRSVSKLK